MRLWLVFKYVSGEWPNAVAEFCGIFDTEEAAIARCTSPLHWIGPANLNESIDDETTPWPGAHYPNTDATDTETG